jgi:hypothetical protein
LRQQVTKPVSGGGMNHRTCVSAAPPGVGGPAAFGQPVIEQRFTRLQYWSGVVRDITGRPDFRSILRTVEP